MVTRKELFTKFLADGRANELSPKQEEVVRRICQGEKISSIAVHFDVTVERINQIANKVKRSIARQGRGATRKSEYEVFLAEVKASGKTLAEISTEGLFSTRLYHVLRHRAKVETLGEIVAKGYWALVRTKDIGDDSIREIREVLGHFGSDLPGAPPK